MSGRVVFTLYDQYQVRPTRRQALKALLTGRPLYLHGNQVSPLVKFGAATRHVSVEAWGGGGGGNGYTRGGTSGAQGGGGSGRG